MAHPRRPLTPDASVRHLFGAELQRLRDEAGLSQNQLGQLVHYSGSMIGSVEKAIRWPNLQLTKALDEALHTDGTLARLLPRVEEQRAAEQRDDTTDGVQTDAATSGSATIQLSIQINGSPAPVPFDRRELLKNAGITLGGLTLGFDPGLTNAIPSPAFLEVRQVGPQVLDALDAQTLSYHHLYHSSAPSLLLPPLIAHVARLDQLAKGAEAGAVRVRAIRSLAQAALLVGRIAFFDLQDALTARAYYGLALEGAEAVEDPLLRAGILGHSAFVAADSRRYGAAQGMIVSGLQGAAQAGSPLVTSWLNAVAAELQTQSGRAQDALTSLEDAERALQTDPATPTPEWADYYDASRLAGFQGFTYLASGRLDDAMLVLNRAIASLDPVATKQRTIYLLDLASAYVRSGDLDQGCHLADQALAMLQLADYATTGKRLHDFVEQLSPWRNAPAVRALTDKLVMTVRGS
jgi:transcriptional regulator with XRE-family HTH domain/tetratricopeptide (TPR) repeat protein